jgi:hypothetical protein
MKLATAAQIIGTAKRVLCATSLLGLLGSKMPQNRTNRKFGGNERSEVTELESFSRILFQFCNLSKAIA